MRTTYLWSKKDVLLKEHLLQLSVCKNPKPNKLEIPLMEVDATTHLSIGHNQQPSGPPHHPQTLAVQQPPNINTNLLYQHLFYANIII